MQSGLVAAATAAAAAAVEEVGEVNSYLLTGEMPTGILGFQSSGRTLLQSSRRGCRVRSTTQQYTRLGSCEGNKHTHTHTQAQSWVDDTHTPLQKHLDVLYKMLLFLCQAGD